MAVVIAQTPGPLVNSSITSKFPPQSRGSRGSWHGRDVDTSGRSCCRGGHASGDLKFLLSRFPQQKPRARFPASTVAWIPCCQTQHLWLPFKYKMLLSFWKSIGGISFYGFTAGFPRALVGAGPYCLSVCLAGHTLLMDHTRNKHRYIKIPRKAVILGPPTALSRWQRTKPRRAVPEEVHVTGPLQQVGMEKLGKPAQLLLPGPMLKNQVRKRNALARI